MARAQWSASDQGSYRSRRRSTVGAVRWCCGGRHGERLLPRTPSQTTHRASDRDGRAAWRRAAGHAAASGGGVVSVPGRRRPSRLRGPAGELRGRRRECDVLDRLIDAVRAGESRALVVRGEPGVGKTALLDYLAEHASGCRVARAAGVAVGDGAGVRRAAPAVRADAGPPRASPGSAARRAADRVRPRLRAGAGPLPGRAGRPRACWPRWPRSSR